MTGYQDVDVFYFFGFRVLVSICKRSGGDCSYRSVGGGGPDAPPAFPGERGCSYRPVKGVVGTAPTDLLREGGPDAPPASPEEEGCSYRSGEGDCSYRSVKRGDPDAPPASPGEGG